MGSHPFLTSYHHHLPRALVLSSGPGASWGRHCLWRRGPSLLTSPLWTIAPLIFTTTSTLTTRCLLLRDVLPQATLVLFLALPRSRNGGRTQSFPLHSLDARWHLD